MLGAGSAAAGPELVIARERMKGQYHDIQGPPETGGVLLVDGSLPLQTAHSVCC